MNTETSKIIRSTRKEILSQSQKKFAIHLSKESSIKSSNITQSTISKYENGLYETPSDILIYCQKKRKEKYSNLEYSKNEIIEKIKIVDSKIHKHSLRAIGIILEQIT